MFTREEVIEAMEQCLNKKEKEILSARWGITTGISIRFEEINEIYGITIEQMRDIERRVSQHIKEYTGSQLYTKEQIIDAIENCLNAKEQQVIINRFGLEDGITRSLSEIELRFGLSREQVRKIEKKVLDYVRSHP